MKDRWCWASKISMFCLLGLILISMTAGAQQAADTEFPLLLSTGLQAAETPEALLPNGAIAYLRANNLQVLLENLDSLVTTFVPEKVLPPDLQPFFENPQPLISFLGTQAFGQPVELNQLSELTGIALDRPVSIALYPMLPQQGFVFSLPIANATVVTGMMQGLLGADSAVEGTIGEVTYYEAETYFGPLSEITDTVYLLTSDTTLYVCGSLNVAEMLVNSAQMGVITQDPVIAKGVQKYADRDLTLVLSPGMLKGQIPVFKEQFAQVLMPVFMQARMVIEQMPPDERLMLDARLRLQFGIDGVDLLVDYLEAYASGIYRVTLDTVAQLLTDLDGLALAINLEQAYQNVSFSLFSQGIQPAQTAGSIPIEEIKQALKVLPGEKNIVAVSGQTPEAQPSKFLAAVLDAVEQELQAKELPMEGFLAVKEFFLAKQPQSSLTSKVAWSVKTVAPTAEKTDFAQFNSLEELFEYAGDLLAAGELAVPVVLMPSGEAGFIQNHFTEVANAITQNGQNYSIMREKLPFRPPFIDKSARFQQADVGDGVKKLTLEKVYTTRGGLFGFQQHELINRQIMFHKQAGAYDLLYVSGADAGSIKAVMERSAPPVPGATLKLLDQAPANATKIGVFRMLPLVPAMLDALTGVEDISHRELDAFLVKAQEIVDTSGAEEFETKLLEAKLAPPMLLASLNLDAEGKVYAVLPGGLHYPRPKVMPKARELFADFLANASEVGGSAAFVAVQPGEFEFSSTQSTEGLALLGKTVVNSFYDAYMATPEGMENLMTALAHPADFQDVSEEELFVNAFWEAVIEEEGFPLLAAIQRSKRSRTVADMRALGTALGSYLVDFNYFPKHPEPTMMWSVDLPPEYYGGTLTDAWDGPFVYFTDQEGQNYLLISYGKDGMPGMGRSLFDADILYMNGQFIAPDEVSYGFMEEQLNQALFLAIQANSFDAVEAVLESGADPDAMDIEGNTAIAVANSLGYADIVSLLEEFGATPLSE